MKKENLLDGVMEVFCRSFGWGKELVDPAHGGQKYPDPAGLSAREVIRALRVLARGPIAGFDICCLAPRYDLQGQLSQLAARAALEVIAGLALQRP